MSTMRQSSPGSRRAVRFWGALALIAASFAACTQPASAQQLVGRQAPVFARRSLSGQTVDLSRLRGKIVLLNFWATWCAPCQAEIPVFAAWQREYGSQGLAVIGISMDDDAATAQRLVEKLRPGYPIAMGDVKIGEQYGGVLGLPMTFLIGRDGQVLAQFQGETDLKTMEARIKSALAGR